MKTLINILTVCAIAASGACAGQTDGPPAIEVDRTACAHCGMLISEPRFAAAYRNGTGEPRVFDDIGCLLASVKRERAAGLRFWFHNATTAAWIDGDGVAFVKSSELRTPMAGGFAAYPDEAAARRAAQPVNGRVIPTLTALLAGSNRGGDL